MSLISVKHHEMTIVIDGYRSFGREIGRKEEEVE